jgi:low affinity Fe/Cu permease
MSARQAVDHVANQADKSTRATRAVSKITGWLGSLPAILSALFLVLAWIIGAAFVSGHFDNNTYQLLINTGTTIITFLMVFIIQNTQNRDGRALQAKIDCQNEALYAIAHHLGVADDEKLLVRLIGLEDAPEPEIREEQDKVRVAMEDEANA